MMNMKLKILSNLCLRILNKRLRPECDIKSRKFTSQHFWNCNAAMFSECLRINPPTFLLENMGNSSKVSENLGNKVNYVSWEISNLDRKRINSIWLLGPVVFRVFKSPVTLSLFFFLILFSQIFWQPDIDECVQSPRACHSQANCTNVPGSFFCQCKFGFTGDGKLNCAGYIHCCFLIIYVS